MQRKANFQTLTWFWDLHNRDLLEMDPPYQRRSVWNQQYRDYFVDTVLHGYPCPAIFLFEYISPEGFSSYSVVDGKQGLSTLFAFAKDEFPVSEEFDAPGMRGLYFSRLDAETKQKFWRYQFSVEYVPSDNDAIINNIFDRINKNVAKLSRQELRHAKYSGEFITAAEELAEELLKILPPNFPNFARQSQRQMKDVELTAQLLLLLEDGPSSFTQDELDEAFSSRETEWQDADVVKSRFRAVAAVLARLLDGDGGAPLARSRLRNQADFYSLFGALAEVEPRDEWALIQERLRQFVETVEDADARQGDEDAGAYYQDARSASNDAGPRRRRIDIMKKVVRGEWGRNGDPQ